MKSAKSEKMRLTRSELTAALARLYQQEQAEYHRLAELSQEMLLKGEAAAYAALDTQSLYQNHVLIGVRRAAEAVGISEADLLAWKEA